MLPLRYALGNLLARRARTALTVSVIALVVVASTLFSGLVSSLKRTFVTSGNPRNLIVMRKGATNDGSSAVPLEAFQALRFFEGVARGPNGQPLASPELVVQPFFHTPGGGRENVLVRGVEPVAFRVHRAVHLVAGRAFAPNLGEVVVGADAARRYGVGIGDHIELGRRHWTVVGLFDSGGTALDSEIWADVSDVQDDTRREGYSGVRVTMAPGGDMRNLRDRIESDGRFTLEAKPEVTYYAEQAETANALYVLVLTLAIVMGAGATFGALNTMYAAVANRTPEIGTLRALGFGRGAILVSFLAESLMLALAGLVAGFVLAGVAMFAINTLLSGVAFSMMTFTVATVLLAPTFGGALLGVGFAAAIGLLGGLGPAWRAAHLPVVEALRHA